MVYTMGHTHSNSIFYRSLETKKMTNCILKFMFCFPRAATPTEEELERMEDYIIAFYELRNNLESFTLARG